MPPPTRGRPDAAEIRVRMYRIGFGDCFLVTIPGPNHVLVDCGVHVGGSIGTMDRVLADIETETHGQLAIVVASHAHEDHISGFARGAERFKRFAINEVWLPWSENRRDPVARGLRARLAGLRTALESQFSASAAPQDILDILENASAKRNEPTLANLRLGLGTHAEVVYVEAGKKSVRPDAGGIPGLTARILGPTRDEAYLKKMDPPKAERFLRATRDGTATEGALHPFGNPPDAVDGGPRLTDSQRDELIRAVELAPEALAFALDRAINNLSIVVMFTYRGKSLLFAGDSQYGGWKSWLDHEDSAGLLEDVCFYKVAHHGSENATPRSALEAMRTGGVTAMISTQSKPWKSIPDEPLLEALMIRTDRRVVRSDSVAVDGAIEGPVLGEPPNGFTVGAFWIDHHIPL